MRLSLYAVLLGGGTVVQSALVGDFPIGGITPDLPLVLTALVAMARGPEAGLLAGFGLGLVQDGIHGGPLGIEALSKALAGFVLGVLPRHFQFSSVLVRAASVLLLSVGEGALRFLLLTVFQSPGEFGEVLVHGVVPQTFYNGAVACLGLAGLSWLEARRQA